MLCKKCGKEMPDEMPSCPHCGEEVLPQEPEMTEEEAVLEDAVPAEEAEPVPMVGLADIIAQAEKKKKKLTKKQIWIRVGIVASSVLAALLVALAFFLWPLLTGYLQMKRESKLDVSDLEINQALADKTGVQNIALFGLDSRKDTQSGRSDAIIILSIDRDHNAIKMTSIARDSLVDIGEFNKRDYGESKINHAFGWGGAKLAVRTLNRNYGMNITDYVYVNFYEFVELVDHVGGILIDVSTSEARVMNNTYAPELLKLGFDYEYVSAGYQRLTGAQALAYSRNRYSDSETERGNRHKEVLQALFDEVKDMSVTQLPSLIGKVLSMCHTTLTDAQMLDIASWALSNGPGFSQFSIPNAECKAKGGNWNDGHGWVWRYDMGLATAVLHKYIYEEEVPYTTTASRHPITTTTTTTTTPPNVSDPNVSDPNVSDPNVSDPNVSDPNVSDPNASDPNVSDPNVSDPNVSDPNVSDPNVSDPNVSDPNVSDPNVSDPNVSDPGDQGSGE